MACRMWGSNIKEELLIWSVFINGSLAYSKEKADEDRSLNKEPLQWCKRTHTMSAICKSEWTKFSREIDSHEGENYAV